MQVIDKYAVEGSVRHKFTFKQLRDAVSRSVRWTVDLFARPFRTFFAPLHAKIARAAC